MFGLKSLDDRKLTIDFFKQIHKILITDESKDPGEFREKTLYRYFWKKPPFEPPASEHAISALQDLEKYINDESSLDPLIKASLIYYQFITIRPFIDGNNRLGRIITNLYLQKNKIVDKAMLYLSHYYQLNTVEFFENIDNVRNKGDYHGWIEFFLKAVDKTSKIMYGKLNELIKIYQENKIKIRNSVYSKTIKNNLIELLKYIIHNPIIDIKNTSRALNKTYPTVAFVVDIMLDMNILELVNDYHRNRIYIYKQHAEVLQNLT